MGSVLLTRKNRALTLCAAAITLAAALYLTGMTSMEVFTSKWRVIAMRLPAGYSKMADQRQMIMQTGANDCGVASAEMFAMLHGHASSFSGLRSRLSLFGLSAQDVAVALDQSLPSHFTPVAVSLRDLPQSQIPVIVLHDHHFAVLEARDGAGIVLMDPWYGRVRVSATVAQKWDVTAIFHE